jgi:hypothetical protein
MPFLRSSASFYAIALGRILNSSDRSPGGVGCSRNGPMRFKRSKASIGYIRAKKSFPQQTTASSQAQTTAIQRVTSPRLPPPTPPHLPDRIEAQPTANASANRSLPKLGPPFEAQPSQYQTLASHSAEQPLWLMSQIRTK